MSTPTQAATNPRLPIVGVTADRDEKKHQAAQAYVARLEQAGAVPILLPTHPPLLAAHVELCDGFVLTGGDDPLMERFGVASDPRSTPVHPDRQAYELALLDLLERERPGAPVLAVCLGMQFMGLHAGGALDQHLPDHLPSHANHAGDKPHAIVGEIGAGTVVSHHVQALTEAGRLRVIGRAHDGVIEAVDDPARAFYLGVQWHPERTDDPALGVGLFQRFVSACRRS
jgi:putative glutamine amidotransferase